MRGATRLSARSFILLKYFNPRSPCGERLAILIDIYHHHPDFNPRSPCGERHKFERERLELGLFQSTLPMRGATVHPACQHLGRKISIHAPHAGSDGGYQHRETKLGDFNPRSPCGERRLTLGRNSQLQMISIHAPHAGSDDQLRHGSPPWPRFQSTLPMRGATSNGDIDVPLDVFQSTLPMRGATDSPETAAEPVPISIHAPHAGSDNTPCILYTGYFYISIHAPHAGSDEHVIMASSLSVDFNPRSPCGERPSNEKPSFEYPVFQSTLPMRGAT